MALLDRLAAGSKNVPPDLEFELRDRKLPDLHLKTGTRGREYNDLHFRALIQMQQRSLTKLSNGNNGPLFCGVLNFKPEDTSLLCLLVLKILSFGLDFCSTIF